MNRRLGLFTLGLAALCVLAYAPGLTSPFTKYDDALYVWQNLERLQSSLATQWSPERALNGQFVEYFPLRDTVYWLIYRAFELDPLPYHLANLAFHVLATLLLLKLLLELGLEEKAALLASLLFAVHPVHVESVVWVAGLKDPMYLSFMLLGLLGYARFRKEPLFKWYALTLAGLIMALLVKSLAIVFPVLMLAMELVLPGPKVRLQTLIARLAGPVIITGLFFATILIIGKMNRSLSPLHGGSFMGHVVLSAWVQAKYLKQALLPTSFRMLYCFEPPTGWGDWRLWVGLVVIAAVGALAWKWRKEPLKLFFVAWYVVTMAPVSNVVPFPAVMADRYLYAPSVAVCALLGLLATQLEARVFRLIAVASAVLLTGASASRSWVWQDEEQLWIEADLDPACLVDTSKVAAQAHVLRSYTAKDPRERMQALDRALKSPGLRLLGEKGQCETVLGAATLAINCGDPRAGFLTQEANRLCPNDALGWNLTMIVNLHVNREVAAQAAAKAWRLSQTPEAEVFVWLTALELNEDPRSAGELVRLARLKRPEVCAKISAWAADVPRSAPALAEALKVCGSS